MITPDLQSNLQSLQAILFDKDGTLFDFHETWRPVLYKAARYAAAGDELLAADLLRSGGYDAPSRRFLADSVIAAGHAAELAGLWVDLGARVARDALHRELDALFAAEGLANAVPVTDLRAFFSTLAERGLILGIATNDSLAGALAAVRQYGLTGLVRFVAGYDSGHGAKPGPGMALAFCETIGLSPLHVAIVGDSEHDMAMGRNAGLGACIGVLSGAGTMESLPPVADLVLKDITGLEHHLGTFPPSSSRMRQHKKASRIVPG